MTRLAFALLLLAGPALGHDGYPVECCSNRDCKPVDQREIGEDGAFYTYQGMKIAKSQSMPSFDERWHACVVPGGFGNRVLRCLLRPTPGS